MTTEIDDGGPFDRVRAALVAEYCSPAVDKMNRSAALAALAELEQKHSATAIQFVKSLNRIAELERERDELRAKLANRDQIIAECAAAVGALVSPECSDEFRAMLPGEIRGKLAKSSPMYSAELSAAMQALKSVQQERDSLKWRMARASLDCPDEPIDKAMEAGNG